MPSILAILIILLKVLGWALAALAVFAILAMSLPVRARVRGSASAEGLLEGLFDDNGPEEIPLEMDFDVEASVLGGALSFSSSAGDLPRVSFLGIGLHPGKTKRSDGAAPSTKAKEEHESPRRRKKKMMSAGQVKRFLEPKVRTRTLKAVRDLFGAFHARGSMDIEYGFPDPGTTAMVMASYWALGGPARFVGLNLRPRFIGESIDVTASGESRLVPIEIVWIAARYLLSREIRPLWWKKRASSSGGADTNRSVGTLSA